jgi:hypothetical protein
MEAQSVMFELAKKLARANLGSDAATVTMCGTIDTHTRDLWGARNANDAALAEQDWQNLREGIFNFDKGVQDMLTSVSDTQACGYQLGRGLAEAYWELDLDPPPAPPPAPAPPPQAVQPTWNSWTFLLGKPRCDELSRLVGRLSAYFHVYTAPGVAGSLSAWQKVASVPDWRNDPGPGPDASPTYVRDECLYRQIRRWYELVILIQDPSTLIKPYAILRNFRALWRGIKGFWIQLSLALISLGGGAYFLFLLSSNNHSGSQKTLVGVASAVGLSATTLSAKLKNAAQSLLARIQSDAYSDLIGLQITMTPPPPKSLPAGFAVGAGRRNHIVTTAVQDRTITAANPSPV